MTRLESCEVTQEEQYHFGDMKVGWIGIDEGDSFYRADIDVGDHGGKIACYAKTPTEAEAMAKQIVAWNTRATPTPSVDPRLAAARELLGWISERASKIDYARYLESEGQTGKLQPEIDALTSAMQDGFLASFRDQFDAAPSGTATPIPSSDADVVEVVALAVTKEIGWGTFSHLEPDDVRRISQAAIAAIEPLLRRKHQLEVATAWQDVIAERQRQQAEEGWTPEHDDEHTNGEMAAAALCYCWAAQAEMGNPPFDPRVITHPPFWPWDDAWWKPAEARRNLVKAGALILAEIERLDRATALETGEVKP